MLSQAAAATAETAKRKKRPTNPLQAGIQSFIAARSQLEQPSSCPKRYTLYAPLLLLPVNFATHSVNWEPIYAGLDSHERTELFQSIANSFSDAGQRITHIAINAPIALESGLVEGVENVVRSPSGLFPVWGDFGPGDLLDRNNWTPSQADFDAAFWVSTTQDHGVSQVWAPRWTMFSHGNLSEKRRILAHPDSTGRPYFSGKTLAQVNQMHILDMYVGIGYFALCYLARGVHRVWGWDLNPWSIEGLRRGCEANGWRCMVVHVSDTGECDNSQLRSLVAQLAGEQVMHLDDQLRCVAFVGDNKWAPSVLRHLEELQGHIPARFDQINLGLLPSSVASWPSAVHLVAMPGILHVHENIHITDLKRKTAEIEDNLTHLLYELGRKGTARVVHVEQVKTYAPGVIHCVLDVQVDDVL